MCDCFWWCFYELVLCLSYKRDLDLSEATWKIKKKSEIRFLPVTMSLVGNVAVHEHAAPSPSVQKATAKTCFNQASTSWNTTCKSIVSPAGMCVRRCCPVWRPPAASSAHAALCLRTSWRSTRCSACRYPTVHCGRRRWGLTSATPASTDAKNVWWVQVWGNTRCSFDLMLKISLCSMLKSHRMHSMRTSLHVKETMETLSKCFLF